MAIKTFKSSDLSGYGKKFKHSIFLNSDGVVEDYIEWCRKNCKGRWGWWYETTREWDLHWDSSGNKIETFCIDFAIHIVHFYEN